MAKPTDAPADISNQAANSPGGQNPAAGFGGADPGLGTATARDDNPTDVPRGQRRVQLSGGWTDRATGTEHAALDWVTVDEQVADDLNTAGYVVRNADGSPLTADQAAVADQALRDAASAAGPTSGGGDDSK